MMTMKFKVGFTISAETLFGIIAKFLPVEDLHVEEVPEILPKIGKVETIARLGGPENRLKPPPLRRNRHNGPSLETGANAIILKMLEDGQPHRYRDLHQAVGAAGYAATGIGSKLTRLRALNVLHQPEIGLWQIGEAPATKKKTA
jgi:hypothetical protein